MNAQLRALLAAAGLDPAALVWKHLLVVHNVAGVPPPLDRPGDFRWNRGFNLVVLGSAGRATHYCKCRGADDDGLARETAVRETLWRDPALRAVVPETHGAASEGIQVQVSRYVRGTPFGEYAARARLSAWVDVSRRILNTVQVLCRKGAELLPHLSPVAAPVQPRAEAEWALDQVSVAGMETRRTEVLREAMAAAGPLPRRLQHGDLWPNNVILARGAHWVLDYEMFGQVQVPLYDALHLVRTSCGLRARRAAPTWIDFMLSGSPMARACAGLLAEAARTAELRQSEQCIGALAYYVVDMAARIHRRATPRAFWEPYTRDAGRLADALRDREALNRAVFGPA